MVLKVNKLGTVNIFIKTPLYIDQEVMLRSEIKSLKNNIYFT